MSIHLDGLSNNLYYILFHIISANKNKDQIDWLISYFEMNKNVNFLEFKCMN